MTTGMDKATLEKVGPDYSVDQRLKLRDLRFLAGPTSGDDGPSDGSGRVELFIDHRAVEGTDGEALLFALKRAGVSLQAVCGGKGACGTCIIHVPPEWRNRTGEPSHREARLLRYLGAGEGDRLSCQIGLGADLNGLEVQSCTKQTKGDEQ